jgi:hypothetical protein
MGEEVGERVGQSVSQLGSQSNKPLLQLADAKTGTRNCKQMHSFYLHMVFQEECAIF